MIRRRRSARPSRLQRALRRSRWRQLLQWIGGRWLSIANSVALFVLALGMLTTSRCRVEQIAVRRQSATAEEAVTRVTQLSHVIGHNIFLLNTERVARELATIPSVMSVRVAPRLPNTVEIDIVERVPIATWRTASAAFLVDDQGFILADAGAERPEPLRLTVTDTTGQELRLGDRIDQRALLAARELTRAMPLSGAHVHAVEYSAQGLVLVTDRGWRVLIGEAESLNGKLASFAAILELARQQNLSIKFVDLRPQDRPFYQLSS